MNSKAKAKSWSVYVLTEGELRVRYIGITSRQLKERLKDHLRNFRQGRNRKNNWIEHCTIHNKTIKIHEIANGLSFERASKLEAWIIHILSRPFDLVNASKAACAKHTLGTSKIQLTHSKPRPLFVVTITSGRKRLLRIELFDTPKGLFPSVTRAVEKVRCVLSNYRPIPT